MQRKMLKIKNTDKNKNLLNVIRSVLVDLENEIKDMSENEIENETSYEIVDIVERIIYISNHNQERQRLKILTPDQMLSRLPINLAQKNFRKN